MRTQWGHSGVGGSSGDTDGVGVSGENIDGVGRSGEDTSGVGGSRGDRDKELQSGVESGYSQQFLNNDVQNYPVGLPFYEIDFKSCEFILQSNSE